MDAWETAPFSEYLPKKAASHAGRLQRKDTEQEMTESQNTLSQNTPQSCAYATETPH